MSNLVSIGRVVSVDVSVQLSVPSVVELWHTVDNWHLDFLNLNLWCWGWGWIGDGGHSVVLRGSWQERNGGSDDNILLLLGFDSFGGHHSS